MKLTTLAVAATLAAATTTSAAELGATGISLGAELDNRYNVDAETFAMTLTPEAGFEKWGFDFTASSDIAVMDQDGFTLGDTLPTLDFETGYGIDMWKLNTRAYVETGFDLEETEMSDIEVGLSLKF